MSTTSLVQFSSTWSPAWSTPSLTPHMQTCTTQRTSTCLSMVEVLGTTGLVAMHRWSPDITYFFLFVFFTLTPLISIKNLITHLKSALDSLPLGKKNSRRHLRHYWQRGRWQRQLGGKFIFYHILTIPEGWDDWGCGSVEFKKLI